MSVSETEIETLMVLKYLEKGIIPHNLDLKAAFENMGPEEARKAKRKFRKIQRKIRKNLQSVVKQKKTRRGWKESDTYRGKPIPDRKFREAEVSKKIKRTEDAWGKKGEEPDYRQRAQRRRLLFSDTYKQVTKITKPKKPQLDLFLK